jgi:hypothetical protein
MLAMTCARCCLPTAADTLTFGLVVMVAAGTYQLLSRGLLSSITASCGSLSGALGGRRWGLWAAWRAAETVSCLALSIGDALLGLGVLLAAPWIVYRSGLLRYGKITGLHLHCTSLHGSTRGLVAMLLGIGCPVPAVTPSLSHTYGMLLPLLPLCFAVIITTCRSPSCLWDWA